MGIGHDDNRGTAGPGLRQDVEAALCEPDEEIPAMPMDVRAHRIAALLARGAVRAAAATPESTTPVAATATRTKT